MFPKLIYLLGISWFACASMACQNMMKTSMPYGKFAARPVDNRKKDLVMSGSHYPASQVDHPPVSKGKLKQPKYPTVLRNMDGMGTVNIVYVIDTHGKVSEIHTVYADDERFVDELKIAMAEWQFEPARHKGRPVSVWASLTFKFTLYNPDHSAPQVIFRDSL